MARNFPSPERNRYLRQLEAQLALDPRSKKMSQLRDIPPVDPPLSICRAGARNRRWGITRHMHGYIVERDTGIQGKAPKWVIRGQSSPDDFYIAKFGKKNGKIEIFTELFNNQLGDALGFCMAHSGMVRLDQNLYFLTRNFRREEALVHGSLLIADLFAVGTHHLDQIQAVAEQEFYSIDFIHDAIVSYCDGVGEEVFQQFVDMLLFDALIGSQDRHAMNWGVLRPESNAGGNATFRLAPLFDSARALLWDLPEGKLLKLDADQESLLAYVRKAKPCIGPKRDHPQVNHCNHFDFISSLRAAYPHQTSHAARMIVDKDIKRIAALLLRGYPFFRGFTALRKRLIIKVLGARADLLRGVLGEGGA
jgi:hypothetical protein